MDVFEFDYYQRLREDYLEHGSLFVAFDYDNTVFDYHNLGINYDQIVELLRDCKAFGFTMILFTGNEGEKLDVIMEDLKSRKIPFDLINENPLMKTRKPYYNILLDDRAGLFEAYTNLKKLINEIRNKEI
jgi:phosphoglycolate phosphatase-like HAD superfamily hydrolase